MLSKKIYDCFIFYNELEILKIRFKELYDYVDFFVIAESTLTFQGKPKPLYFQENKAEFSAFGDKIIHVIVDDMEKRTDLESPESEGVVWGREHHQRNALRRGLNDLSADDVVIISDCDEIVSPLAIEYMRNNSGYFLLDMPMFQFYLNMCAMDGGWRKPFAYTWNLDCSIQDYNFPRTNELPFFEKFSGKNHYLKNSGWHFTFAGGADQVKKKLLAYSHTDGWQRSMWDDRVLQDQMLALRAVGNSKILRFCRIDSSFPKILQQNVNEYINLGLIKDEWRRLKELEYLWGNADARYQDALKNGLQASRSLAAMRRIIHKHGLEIAESINLIPSSKDFSQSWHHGEQSKIPVKIQFSPAVVPGDAVMQHFRDDNAHTPDQNVGCFNHLPIEPEKTYTASAYIWLPNDFRGQGVDLSFDLPNQAKKVADGNLKNVWQRISVTLKMPASITGCNVVMRAYGDQAFDFMSSAWQLEEGGIATEYYSTEMSLSDAG